MTCLQERMPTMRNGELRDTASAREMGESVTE